MANRSKKPFNISVVKSEKLNNASPVNSFHPSVLKIFEKTSSRALNNLAPWRAGGTFASLKDLLPILKASIVSMKEIELYPVKNQSIS